jgi:sugar phosphate isomerase/epimerase
MPKFAANLSFLYAEHAFLDRFAAAAADGFRAVEFLFPYDETPARVAAAAKAAGVAIVLFNLPPGDWDRGERGLAALKGREAEFDAALANALDYAQALGCKRVHAMAGRVEDGASGLRSSPSTRATSRAISSIARTRRMRSARPWARLLWACRWTFTIARSSRATWRARSKNTCQAFATCRSRARPTGTSPARASLRILIFSS